MTNDYYIKKIFDRWSDQIIGYNNYRANYLVDYVTDVTIVQLNKKNLPIYKVVLHNAYPITFNPITLDNNAENTAQKFSVTLTYENFFVDKVPTVREQVDLGIPLVEPTPIREIVDLPTTISPNISGLA
jgi:hypothetical protein